MGRRASPTLIGAFVVGAVVLAIAGVLVFGSGKLFRQTLPVVFEFGGNLNGLAVGAPIKFKGVPIGAVTAIRLELEEKPNGTRIPVEGELDVGRVDEASAHDLTRGRVRQAVERGLRARLEAESFVTGVLYVNLDYYPEPRAVAMEPDPGAGPIEIPTVPTQVEVLQSSIREILKKLDRIDLTRLVDEITRTATSIAELAKSQEIKSVLASLNETLVTLRGFVTTLDRNVEPIADGVAEAVEALRDTLVRAQAVEAEIVKTLSTTSSILDPKAPVTVELRRALSEFDAAARSVRELADYLQRNPNALVVGRSPAEGRAP